MLPVLLLQYICLQSLTSVHGQQPSGTYFSSQEHDSGRCAGYYLTNRSLTWLDYPTRIAFKSSKMLPVMLLRTTVLGRQYNAMQYSSAVTLVAGIALFTSGALSVS